ncbi:MAG TPA: transporter substrate-binding domain-containing protein [Bradyrhizobium sp.]|nr:transporter substrate-binding domain-containing protein [Bradyrhizobium sp.]
MSRKAASVLIMMFGVLIGGAAATAEPLPERIQRGEPVRQGIANDAPFGYVDKSGATVGIEVEMIRLLLGKLGAKSIEPIGTSFGALIPGIQANRFDVVSDGIYIRPERCRAVKFAQPHFMISVGAFVKKGSAIKAGDLAELAKNPSLKVGILTGGGEGRYFVAAGGKQDQISDFADRAGLASGLKSGRIDVALLTSIGAASTVHNDPELSLLTPFRPVVIDGKPQVSYAAFAFNQADAVFVEAFNKELTAYIASPEYPKLLAKYGVTADVIPPAGVSVDDLCK